MVGHAIMLDIMFSMSKSYFNFLLYKNLTFDYYLFNSGCAKLEILGFYEGGNFVRANPSINWSIYNGRACNYAYLYV